MCTDDIVLLHQRHDTGAEAGQTGQVAQDMENVVVPDRAQPEQEFEEAGITADGFCALERHDEQIGWKDGVLHDGTDLVRAVDDNEIKVRSQILRGEQLTQERRIALVLSDLTSEVFQTVGAGHEGQVRNSGWLNHLAQGLLPC